MKNELLPHHSWRQTDVLTCSLANTMVRCLSAGESKALEEDLRSENHTQTNDDAHIWRVGLRLASWLFRDELILLCK